MPRITAIEPQRRKGRVNIFIDGEFVLGVGEQVAAEVGLRPGREMTPETLTEVVEAEEIHKAVESALLLLDVRDRATREIMTRLRQKGYEENIISAALDKLRRLGLLDDAQFARQWVEARSRPTAGRPLGKRRLTKELMQKGVAKDQIAEAIETMTDESELALARAAAQKKIRTLPSDKESLMQERQRLTGFLQRRGFGWEIVKQVAKETLPDSDETFDSASDFD